MPFDIEKVRARREAEVAAGNLRWFYVSFADEERFYGGVHIKAYGPVDAHIQTFELKLNPVKGSVMLIATPPGWEPPEWARDRLLSEEEVNRLSLEINGEPAVNLRNSEWAAAALENAKKAGEASEED